MTHVQSPLFSGRLIHLNRRVSRETDGNSCTALPNFREGSAGLFSSVYPWGSRRFSGKSDRSAKHSERSAKHSGRRGKHSARSDKSDKSCKSNKKSHKKRHKNKRGKGHRDHGNGHGYGHDDCGGGTEPPAPVCAGPTAFVKESSVPYNSSFLAEEITFEALSCDDKGNKLTFGTLRIQGTSGAWLVCDLDSNDVEVFDIEESVDGELYWYPASITSICLLDSDQTPPAPE